MNVVGAERRSPMDTLNPSPMDMHLQATTYRRDSTKLPRANLAAPSRPPMHEKHMQASSHQRPERRQGTGAQILAAQPPNMFQARKPSRISDLARLGRGILSHPHSWNLAADPPVSNAAPVG